MSVLSRSALARVVPALLISTLALTGCASLSLTGATPTATVNPDAPVTVDNCGTEVTFDEAPERVVTIKSTSTEMLLALGLGDRIVGTGFQDGPVPEKWADDAAALVSLSDKVPSEEVVLETEPDLVYAGWESNFSAEGAGERPELESLGVHTYVSPSACQSANQPAKLTFDNIFDDITEVASIFRVDATELIAGQREQLAELKAGGDAGLGRTALWYSSGSDTPYVGAGIGAPELVLETLGLENIAGDVDATWAPLSWEAVVDGNPYYIVLVDAAWNTAESKIALLEGNPATANLTAVQQGRYLIVPFAASEAGVRTVDTVVDLREQMTLLDGP